MMNLHLAEISTQVALGAHAELICDGAGWHRKGELLNIPENMTLLPLPPYSPELNPMENVWDYLRQNKLCGIPPAAAQPLPRDLKIWVSVLAS